MTRFEYYQMKIAAMTAKDFADDEDLMNFVGCYGWCVNSSNAKIECPIPEDEWNEDDCMNCRVKWLNEEYGDLDD